MHINKRLLRNGEILLTKNNEQETLEVGPNTVVDSRQDSRCSMKNSDETGAAPKMEGNRQWSLKKHKNGYLIAAIYVTGAVDSAR